MEPDSPQVYPMSVQERRRRITAEQIDAARTPAGGWTREQLAAWGVSWPPPKGWKQALLKDAK